nr:immunoglobulin light chain junction region [Macaca mulatta]MOV81130.1 immunoglobulin light chain junction region [Macaca mulatta]MOV85474.1 immunoglobulin light chain junction region [Macaca mulatta]
CQNYNDWPLTF